MADASDESADPGVTPRLKLRVLTVTVYAIAGPPAGALLLILAAVSREAVLGLHSRYGLQDEMAGFGVTLALGYVVGLVPACATGVLVAAKLSWSPRKTPFLLGSASAGFLVTWLLAVLWMSGTRGPASLHTMAAAWLVGLLGAGAALASSGVLLRIAGRRLSSAFPT